MKKKVKPSKPSTGGKSPSILAGKKKKIFAILLLLFSILILLSIISYSRFDRANLSNSFSDLSTSNPKADTRNWLGIIGAYVSDFFIRSTLGISSIIFPVLLLGFGLSLLKLISYRRLINTSNFLLIAGLLLSTVLGVFRTHFQVFSDNYELSGSVGDYLGLSLSHLLGGVGSLILLFAAAIILFVIAFDIKLENIFHFIESLFIS